MSLPRPRRGDTGAFWEHPCLHCDKPCTMKTPGMPQCKASGALMKNYSATVNTGGDRIDTV